MLLRKYEMPWRRAVEMYAALAWACASSFLVLAVFRGAAHWRVVGALALVAALMAIWRFRQALTNLVMRASLGGRAIEFASHERVRGLCRNEQDLFLGFGFRWLPEHGQRVYELAKINWRKLVVPAWVLRLTGRSIKPMANGDFGEPYIHGVEINEQPLYRPVANFEGGTCIAGTTQSGKGVVLSMLVFQAIKRGDVVIIIDPKNSDRLKNNVIRACHDMRAPDCFVEFHPAFPDRGVRFDCMYTFQKATELASRIKAILPPDTAGAFQAFGWEAVNVVVQALVDLEDRPNLAKLAMYIDGGIEPILEKSLTRFFDENLDAQWRESAEMRKVMQEAKGGHIRRPSERATAELMAYVAYYERHIPEAQRSKVIDPQIRTFRHNREHYRAITANLLPILSMLTSGDLGRSLSPNAFDLDDKRPIMNLEKLDRGQHVFYLALDALPDAGVADAIAGLFLADLAAYCGMRYNLGTTGHKISLFVDEASNVINQPLIQIMNKGAEGKVHTTLSMQTLGDLTDRLGSEAAARMALGNLNNLFVLRSPDEPTQKYLAEKFGQTAIHTARVGLSGGSDAHIVDFSTSYSTQITETPDELVPPDLLGKLPNREYFASVGGQLLKGRAMILDPGPPVRSETVH